MNATPANMPRHRRFVPARLVAPIGETVRLSPEARRQLEALLAARKQPTDPGGERP